MNTITSDELVRVQIPARFVRLRFLTVILCLFWPTLHVSAQSAGLQRVLVLYSDEHCYRQMSSLIIPSVRPFKLAPASGSSFIVSSLDVSRFSGEALQEHHETDSDLLSRGVLYRARDRLTISLV